MELEHADGLRPWAYWVRASWRRTLRGAGLLAILIAVGAGGVMAAAASARRTASADERLAAISAPPEAFAFAASPEAFDEMAARPEVAAASGFIQLGLQPSDVECSDTPDAYFQILVPAAGTPFATPRPRLLHGRMAALTAPDEAVLTEQHARRLGVEVGDRITYLPYVVSDEGISGCGADVVAEVEVVGIIREITEIGTDEPTLAWTFLTPAFVDEHPDVPVITFAGIGGFVDLRQGESPGAFQQAVAASAEEDEDGQPDRGVFLIAGDAPFVPALDALSVGFWALVAVLAVATLVTLAVTVTRQVAAVGGDLRVLRALGATRAQRALAAATPVGLAAVVAIPAAVALALALSRVHLIGIARIVEPEPGFDVDGSVIALGVMLTIAAVVLLCVPVAVRSARSVEIGETTSDRHGAIGTAIRRVLPPWAAVGASYVIDRARRGSALPTRGAAAMLAAAAGGLVAVLVFGVGVSRASEDPRVYGWGEWDALATPAEEEDDDRIDVAEVVSAERSIAAVSEVNLRFQLDLEGEQVSGITVEHVKGQAGPTVVDGRLPRGPSEIGLGRRTAQDIGASLGDSVRADGPRESADLEVVGIIAFVSIDGSQISSGFLAERSAVTALGHGPGCNNEECIRQVALAWKEGVDVPAATERLASAGIGLNHPRPGAEVDLISEADEVPGIAAVGVAVVAVVGVLHALAATSRRRRHELATLSALGFSRWDRAGVIVAEAVTLGLIGAVVGGVIGIAAGRTAWTAAARSIGIGSQLPSIAGLTLAVTAGVLLVPVVVSLWPARTAARFTPGHALRAE